MDLDRHLRQQDAVNMNRLSLLGISVIGAGSIGSTTSVFLGKMGACGLEIWDSDVIAAHNWSNQLYRDSDIGRSKVKALQEIMEDFGGHTPNCIAAKYTNQPLSEVAISCVDSMESRKTIWKAVRDQPDVRLYIDARMGLETLVVYAVRPQVKEDRVAYSQTLVSDLETLQEPCTARTICFTPLMAAAVVCNLVKRYVNDESLPSRVILDLATFTVMAS
jgi:hypothetical protein